MNKKNIFIFIIMIILIIIFTIIIKSKTNNYNEQEKVIIKNDENKTEQTNTWNISQKLDEEKKVENNTGQIVTTSESNEHNEYLKKLLEKQKYENSIPQSEKEKIDEYNFWELEKVKINLSNFQKWDFTIRNYIDYNRKYDPDIKPIKNCNYVSTENWKEPFIFWFKLESDKYKNKYWTWTYVYPKYDLPKDEICFWLMPSKIEEYNNWNNWCDDKNNDKFMRIIEEPCRWYISWYIYDDSNKNWIKDEWETWVEWYVIMWTIIVKTDKDWYYSFGDIWWKRELRFRKIPTWYDYSGSDTITINIEKWVIKENINFWVYKR